MPEIRDFFAELLQTIDSEQERATILGALQKDPKTSELVQRINRFATDGENYSTWHKEHSREYEDAYSQAPVLRGQLAEAQKTIDGLKAELASGKPAVQTEEFDMGEMTKEQLQSLVNETIKSQGFVTRQEAETLAEAKANERAAAALGRVFTHGLPQVEAQLLLRRKFEQDFPGKQFDRAKFDDFIAKGSFKTLDDAYAAFTQADYTDKVKAEAFEQGKLQGSKETEEKLRKEMSESAVRSLPIDMGGASGVPSVPGQPPPEPVELEKIDQDYTLGQRGGFKLAAAIAHKVRQDRASGKQI